MFGYNGALRGKSRTPSLLSASGIWDCGEQCDSRRANIWPTTGDPYWNDVSLLLHMDGSNGSTTFTDSSSNALTVTANGNAQISTAQSKFGGASGYFDGTGDFLTVTNSNNVLTFSSDDFTIEFWLYPLDTSTLQVFLDFRPDVQGAYPVIYVQSGTLHYYVNTGSRISASSALTTNQWQHVAVARSGTETKMYVDAVQVGSTYTDANSYDAPTCRIATSFDSYAANAYIDDLRITKGVARYTANFTAPTAAFPNG
jgi:hypothetical protein